MNKRLYYVIIIVLVILSIFGIYNFTHPIKNLNDTNIINEGKVLGITKEYDYNEKSEYVNKYYIEILVSGSEEHISIEINEDELSNYESRKKVNFYEEKGEYFITESKKTPKNGGIIWIVLSIIELIVAIIIFKNKLKK